jgi:hypothetical protein
VCPLPFTSPFQGPWADCLSPPGNDSLEAAEPKGSISGNSRSSGSVHQLHSRRGRMLERLIWWQFALSRESIGGVCVVRRHSPF